MADEEQDPLGFIIENCRISSSQEELLSVAKFAREDEIFSEEENLQAKERCRWKSDGADDSGVKVGGKLAAGAPNRGTPKNLGFRGERKGESSGTKLEGVSGVKREIEVQLKGKEKVIEPQLKKSRVSPLVHSSGKMVIKGENGDEAGDLKMKKVSFLSSAAPGCTEKMRIESDDVQIVGEIRTGNRGKRKKLDIDLNIEAIDVEEEDEIVEISNFNKEAEAGDHGKGSGKVADGEKKKQGDGEKTTRGEEEEGMIRKRGKRELPRSMFVVWGEGTGDVFNIKKNVEGGSKEANVEGAKDGSKEANVEGAKGGSKEANVEGAKDGSKEANVEGAKDGSKEANVEGAKDGSKEANFEEAKDGSKEANVEGAKGGSKEANVEGAKGGSKEVNVEGEKGSKEGNVDVNRGEKSKKRNEEEAMKCILEGLRRLVKKCSEDVEDDDDGGDDGEEEFDIFETAKRCGMTFPRSRFLPEVEED